MAESILFLTGHLARPRLEAVLDGMKAGFDWKVLDIGVKVAALMTEDIIARRLPKPVEADKIMLPGRCRADLDRLSERFGVPVLARARRAQGHPPLFRPRAEGLRHDQIRHPDLRRDRRCLCAHRRSHLKRAQGYAQRGANVIDLGCLPDTPFPHLEEAIRTLKEKGYKVSVDSAERRTSCCAAARPAPIFC